MKVIRLKTKPSPALLRLLGIADALDRTIIDALADGTVNHRDLAGVVAHRLGTLLGSLQEPRLLEHCVGVMIRQVDKTKSSC
jgi:hypothetical protein